MAGHLKKARELKKLKQVKIEDKPKPKLKKVIDKVKSIFKKKKKKVSKK